MSKVLLVDDEQTLLQALTYNLKKEGYDVVTAVDGIQAVTTARSEQPDVIVLDLMLPGLNGLEVCRTIRGESTVPILMLTARSDEMDRVLGLELGADEYVVKPVGLRELMARIKAILRRTQMTTPRTVIPGRDPQEVVEVGPLIMNASSREALWNGGGLDLRPKEFDLLFYLAQNHGRVLSRASLLAGVWGYDYVGDARTVDVHIRWIREKLEPEPSKPRYLQTLRGTGYKLAL